MFWFWLITDLKHFLILKLYLLFLDIGSNIGPHSLTIAAMEREVIVVDAVFYNLALISMSHKMTNKGKVSNMARFQKLIYPLFVKFPS